MDRNLRRDETSSHRLGTVAPGQHTYSRSFTSTLNDIRILWYISWRNFSEMCTRDFVGEHSSICYLRFRIPVEISGSTGWHQELLGLALVGPEQSYVKEFRTNDCIRSMPLTSIYKGLFRIFPLFKPERMFPKGMYWACRNIPDYYKWLKLQVTSLIIVSDWNCRSHPWHDVKLGFITGIRTYT